MADIDLATVLADGEYLKREGDTLVGDIPATGGGGTGVTDGDKGDIVVSASGATWLFDSTVVTAAAKTVLDDATVAAMRTTLGAAAVTRTVIGDGNSAVTAALSHAGAYLWLYGSNQTYTIPPNSSVPFPVGTQIDGTGAASAMTLIAGSGVTINKARTLVTVGAKSGWTLIKVDTDMWDCHGDFV